MAPCSERFKNCLKCLRTLYFDGACKVNQGGRGGAGWVIKNLAGETEIEDCEIEDCKFVGENSSSEVAEYTALIEGLKAALKSDFRVLIAYSDSKLVCHQVNGAHEPKENHILRPYYKEAMRLKQEFQIFSSTYIPRDLNMEADSLANQAIKDYVRRSEQK